MNSIVMRDLFSLNVTRFPPLGGPSSSSPPQPFAIHIFLCLTEGGRPAHLVSISVLHVFFAFLD